MSSDTYDLITALLLMAIAFEVGLILCLTREAVEPERVQIPRIDSEIAPHVAIPPTPLRTDRTTYPTISPDLIEEGGGT